MTRSPSWHRDKIKDDLLESKAHLFSGDMNNILLMALRFFFPSLSCAFVIDSIPEQEEDIFFVLIDEKKVAIIEIPRGIDAGIKNILIEVVSVEEYKKRSLVVDTRRKLCVALDLMHENMT